jgi:hypothetical protein
VQGTAGQKRDTECSSRHSVLYGQALAAKKIIISLKMSCTRQCKLLTKTFEHFNSDCLNHVLRNGELAQLSLYICKTTSMYVLLRNPR